MIDVEALVTAYKVAKHEVQAGSFAKKISIKAKRYFLPTKGVLAHIDFCACICADADALEVLVRISQSNHFDKMDASIALGYDSAQICRGSRLIIV